MRKPLFIAFIVLLIDQIIKIYVKTHFFLGEEVHLAGDWAIIQFTENKGMAYGMEFGGEFGKLFLTIFRILAVCAIGYYLWTLAKKKEDKLYIVCIALIFAGAIGNIIDSVFYGVLFSESRYLEAARFMPEEGGYAPLLHGSVVDMFHFPVFEGHFPSWFPIWGTEDFEFFRPIFNFADFSISIGVAMIILYQKRFFGKKKVADIAPEMSDIPTETGPTIEDVV